MKSMSYIATAMPAVACSACGSVQILGDARCVQVSTAYSGPVKPIESVGVAVLERSVFVMTIDGETYDRKRFRANCGAMQGANLTQQIHLLPGIHELKLVYAETPGQPGALYTKGWTSLFVDAQAGGIYWIYPNIDARKSHVSFGIRDIADSSESTTSIRAQFEEAKKGAASRQ